MKDNSSKKKYLIAIPIFLIGILLSLAVFFTSLNIEDKYLNNLFNKVSNERVINIIKETESHAYSMYAVRGLFYVNKNLERQEFAKFTRGSILHSADLLTLEWIPSVNDAERDKFEKNIAKKGFPDFQITEYNAQGVLKRAPQKTEYFPVLYVEPFEENKSLLGYNMASESRYLEAMVIARDTRTSVATERIKLPLKADDGFYYKIFMPTYIDNVPLNTIEERRRHLIGYTVGTFSIKNTVEHSIKTLIPAGIDIALYDNSASEEKRLLYVHESRLNEFSQNFEKDKAEDYSGMEFEKNFNMSGRKWQIICRPSQIFLSRNKQWYSLILLISGFAMTILFTIYISTIQERENHVKLLVDERTTELNKANKKLTEQKELLQAIIDNTSACIYLKDTAGKYVVINKQFENLFNITKENVVGRTDNEIFPKKIAELFCANDKKVIEAGHILEFEEYAPHDDGVHTYLSIKAPMHDSDGNINGVYGISTDITGRDRMKEGIEKMQRLEAIGILSGGIAHDFNNLLAAVLGNVGLAKMHLDPGEKSFEKLTIAENSCLQATELTNRLLTFSKGSINPKKPTEIPALLKETINPLLYGSNTTSKFNISDNLSPVSIDKEQIKAVIRNFTINARDAMPRGGILKISTENIILKENNSFTLNKGDYMKISIEDDGIGIPKENLSKIFDPYFTTKPMGSTKGMGLGLSVAYSVVKKHDGIIDVDSKVGAGTTFHIYLPIS